MAVSAGVVQIGDHNTQIVGATSATPRPPTSADSARVPNWSTRRGPASRSPALRARYSSRCPARARATNLESVEGRGVNHKRWYRLGLHSATRSDQGSIVRLTRSHASEQPSRRRHAGSARRRLGHVPTRDFPNEWDDIDRPRGDSGDRRTLRGVQRRIDGAARSRSGGRARDVRARSRRARSGADRHRAAGAPGRLAVRRDPRKPRG